MDTSDRREIENVTKCPRAIKIAVWLAVISAIAGLILEVMLFTSPPAHRILPDSEAIISIFSISVGVMEPVAWIIIAIATIKGKLWGYYALLTGSWLIFRTPPQLHRSYIWIILWLIFMALMLIGARRYHAFVENMETVKIEPEPG
jgi:hypothetical protein